MSDKGNYDRLVQTLGEGKKRRRMKQYKVVRTYNDGSSCENDLQKAFDDGYKFVRASEYVPEANHGGRRRYGYIEYVLAKKETETTERMGQWIEESITPPSE